MHEDSILVDPSNIHLLIQDHAPEYAHLEISQIDSPGTVNQIYRLGSNFVCKFPFHPTSKEDLEVESSRFVSFKNHSSLLVPQLIKICNPSDLYPNYWTIYTYIEGQVLTTSSHHDSSACAVSVGKLISEIRTPKPHSNVFAGRGRGGVLFNHDEDFREYCSVSEGLFDTDTTLKIWDKLKYLPSPKTLGMTHGDLQPQNLIVEDSRLVGVLDCGSYGVADPALDLICAWHTFDSARREVVKQTVGMGDEEWLRGAAWALTQSVGLAKYYELTNPEMSMMGINTINKVLESDEILNF